MAVANTKATNVTNPDSTPSKANPLHIHAARLYEIVGTVEVAAADSDNSVYRMARVHSSWRISSIEVFNDAITSGSVYDLGLYDTAENGGAVISGAQELFASDVTMVTARSTPTELTYEATATNIDKIEKRLWELLGLTADPGKWYDIAFTATTVGSGAGTISLRVRFVGPA